ncbi:NAD-P-binding protein [Mycena albidolilacea]|uniref:NAD-P-binding protein n=1 Tax=Mycena albidolilacea TaxID=1033008 RepID=A0AAD6ZWA3_9AGAR|nr:NAD-P-binding protein [Mycena albidolilacea]
MPLPTFSFSTTAEDVAAAFAEQIRGKNVLITGTSINGIGFEAARVLAKYANLVIIAGYNSERLKLSEEAIKKEVPGANIRQLVLDLSSLAAVRKAGAEVNQYSEPLHVLIHNAAAPVVKYNLTVDGFESQMAAAHIGPFLLTKLLAPKLLAARSESYTPRVITVSSELHSFGSLLDLDAVARPDPAKYATPGEWYIQAKSANILFASELARRAQGKIHAYSLHPGSIFTNILQKEETKKDMIAIGTLTADGLPNEERWPWKTLGQGAATTLVAAVDTRLNATPNAFLWDCVEANDKVAPHCADPETAAKLWTITEELVGEKFTF